MTHKYRAKEVGTEKECPKCNSSLIKWFNQMVWTGMHCSNCGYHKDITPELLTNNKE